MSLLKVDSIDQARAKLLNCAKVLDWSPVEVEIKGSVGQVVWEDIHSPEDLPEFRRSTVDGYAVRAEDTTGASEGVPTFLTLTGQVEMGGPAKGSVAGGECVYVPTGGMIPQGASAMVMVEYTEIFGSQVVISSAVAAGFGVVEVGEDVKKGALLIKKGTRLRPQEVGALAALGITSVKVAPKLGLTVISTGDEIIPPEQVPTFGEIRDINSYTVGEIGKQKGFRLVDSLIVRDNRDALKSAIAKAMETSDIVAVSGGSSKGKKDYTAEIIEELTSSGVVTHGVAIKPGKPTILGGDDRTGSVIIGLPGHPVSAMVVFEVMMVWLYQQLTCLIPQPPIPAVMAKNVASAQGRTTYQLVGLDFCNGGYTAEPVMGRSGLITTLTRSVGYVIIPQNKEGLEKGEQVLVHLT